MPFGPELILSAFLLFCRIGACLMLMPGFSSSRVPVNVRLFIAISCTLALTPLLAPQLQGVGSGASPIGIARIIIGETLIGALIGFMARLFFLGTRDTRHGSGNGDRPCRPISVLQSTNPKPLPPLVSLISLTATTLFFVSDQHLEVFRGLSASYVALPVAQGFDTRFGLVQIERLHRQGVLPCASYRQPVHSLFDDRELRGRAREQADPADTRIFHCDAVRHHRRALPSSYFSFKQFLDVFIYGFANWLSTG